MFQNCFELTNSVREKLDLPLIPVELYQRFLALPSVIEQSAFARNSLETLFTLATPEYQPGDVMVLSTPMHVALIPRIVDSWLIFSDRNSSPHATKLGAIKRLSASYWVYR